MLEKGQPSWTKHLLAELVPLKKKKKKTSGRAISFKNHTFWQASLFKKQTPSTRASSFKKQTPSGRLGSLKTNKSSGRAHSFMHIADKGSEPGPAMVQVICKKKMKNFFLNHFSFGLQVFYSKNSPFCRLSVDHYYEIP